MVRGPLTGGRPLDLAAAVLTGLQVGAATFVTHFAVSEAGPASLALFRYIIALLIILPIARPRLKAMRRADLLPSLKAMRRADLLPMALLGIGQFGLLILFLNIAVQNVDPGRATLIFSTFPILTMIFAVALGRERFTWRGATGIVMTVAGVALSVGAVLDFRHMAADEWTGCGAAFLSAAIGAACSIGYRPYLQRNPTVAVSFSAMAAAVVFLVIPASFEGLFSGWSGFSAIGWAASPSSALPAASATSCGCMRCRTCRRRRWRPSWRSVRCSPSASARFPRCALYGRRYVRPWAGDRRTSRGAMAAG